MGQREYASPTWLHLYKIQTWGGYTGALVVARRVASVNYQKTQEEQLSPYVPNQEIPNADASAEGGQTREGCRLVLKRKIYDETHRKVGLCQVCYGVMTGRTQLLYTDV